MKAFARLYAELDESTSLNDKVDALARYLADAPPSDAAWAVHVLSGNRPKRVVPVARLREWTSEAAGIAPWLMEECRAQVGDLAETMALLLPGEGDPAVSPSLTETIEARIIAMRDMTEGEQRATLLDTWRILAPRERFVFNKLITGAFRVGAAARLVVRGIARASGIEEPVIAHRLMGEWEPSADAWMALVAVEDVGVRASRPYPFALATALDIDPAALGPRAEWQAEWKWDGIRAQLVRRGGSTWLWSRGEELMAGRFPELESAATHLPDGTVLDGEVLPWEHEGAIPLPFASLQRRIQRKAVTRAILREVPVVFVAYDLLEADGADLRDTPLIHRRRRLEEIVGSLGSCFRTSPIVDAPDWEGLARARGGSRDVHAEGLMLKRLDGAYLAGRKRGGWWKWKVDPFTVDAVLVAAQGGSGRRAGLFTDYTFAVWDGDTLVTLAKAYSGLTDAEIRQVDAFVRANTLERFGPVRTVQPQLVFELAFEGLQASARHKSGIALRFPRIARWRTDKQAADADTLDTVRRLLDARA